MDPEIKLGEITEKIDSNTAAISQLTKLIEQDSINIRALARIAEAHERAGLGRH